MIGILQHYVQQVDWFLMKIIKESQNEQLQPASTAIESQIAEFSYKIYGNSYPPYLLVEAWKLRKYNPILYLEQSLMWNSWLALDADINWNDEIIISEAKQRKEKNAENYNRLLDEAFSEIARVLKPGRYFSMAFNCLDDKTWIDILNLFIIHGFEIADIIPLEYSATSVIQDNRKNALKTDFVLTFIMLGSVLGFLVHNFHPASIFAGDSGSLFMGFMIAIIALLGFKSVTLTSLIIPLLILAIPILDTVFAIIRRLLKGEKISKPDKSHLHHQLLNKNFSHKATVLIIYGIDILFAAASIIYALHDSKLGYIIYAVLTVIVIIFVLKTDIIVDKAAFHKKHKEK